MQNILAAQSEGTTLRNTYINTNSMSSSHTFIIPVYENMPQNVCSRPDTNGTSSTDMDLVKVNVEASLRIRNSPNGDTTVGWLYSNEIVTRLEKTTSKVNGTYWDKVQKADGTIGYAARETYEGESSYKLYLVPVSENSSSSSTLRGDVDGDNEITANDYVIIKLNIMGKRNLTNQERSRADYDNDNEVTANDYVLIKKYIMSK